MKLAKILVAAIIVLPFTACQHKGNTNPKGAMESDSALAVTQESPSANNALVDAFFKDFQEKNDGWTKTEAGHQKLVEAFKQKITTDIQFAKACACYDTEYEYTNSIKASETISSYSKDDGEEGEIKAFDFVINVDLVKPLYNGQKTISVKYEIISTIPSTIEEHWRPYVEKANYCSTFDSFLKNGYEATLDLGCYIVTFKE